MKGLFKIFCAAVIFMCAVMFSAAVFADEPIAVLMDGGRLSFDTEPQIVDSRAMVPMRTIFEAYGAEVLWDEGTETVTAMLDDMIVTLQIGNKQMINNDKFIELDVAPVIYGDRTLVPVRAVSEAFGSNVDWDPDDRVVIITSPVEKNSTMDGTVISDEFRYENYDGEYNGVSVFDNAKTDYFGMELLSINPGKGEEYAAIVSGMAEDLPNTRVFCGIVPTAAEFYASATYKTNYLSAISHIYNNLSSSVIPVNIEKVMMENSDKYLYFRTDHHWTHLGSYYAYREFCAVSGNIPAELGGFETITVEDYMGSWGGVVANTYGYNMLSQSKDTIEIYLPGTEYIGKSYSDMNMNSYMYDIRLIAPSYESYTMFIEGDNPLVYFHTDIENGRSICIIKDSYGNAFSSWLVNNYENIYILDYRIFNGNSDNDNSFSIGEFYELHPFDDLLVLSYPYTIAADDLRHMLGQMWRSDY